MTIRDMQRLEGVHPMLITALKAVFGEMEAAGHPMFVVEGLRTEERQYYLYTLGRTRPGKIVTQCDGMSTKSNHQAKTDKFGHAVDCAFADSEPFGEHQPWLVYGVSSNRHGLKWGGDWRTPDRPHVELP